jgi:hypothetical protein
MFFMVKTIIFLRFWGEIMSKTVIICGAGVDKSPGLDFPLATELVPQIRQYLQTDEVKEIDNISWHIFSNENESTIFQFYRAVGIPNDQIGNLKAPVKKRNDILHTNGIYLTSEDDFEERSQNYLQNLEKIHLFCADEYKTLFIQTISKIEESEYPEEKTLFYLAIQKKMASED